MRAASGFQPAPGAGPRRPRAASRLGPGGVGCALQDHALDLGGRDPHRAPEVHHRQPPRRDPALHGRRGQAERRGRLRDG
jgi:hypothetical protein